MAEPKRAAAAGVVPLNITWDANKGYELHPPNPDIDPDSTARFNASNKSCTICFSPTDTPFGASLNVNVGTHVDVGPGDFTVDYCIADSGGTCVPGRPQGNPMGTITVGSGGRGGGKR